MNGNGVLVPGPALKDLQVKLQKYLIALQEIASTRPHRASALEMKNIAKSALEEE